MRQLLLRWLACAVAGCGLAFGGSARGGTVNRVDFVFIVDASVSMSTTISAVQSGLSSFVTGLNAADIDARFAIVLFGGAPELVLDFTSSGAATETAFNTISVTGAVAGFQNNHNANPEAGLEAIRIILGEAVNNTLARDNVGGAGGLAYRADARKNLILVTDEDSDLPFFPDNRVAGQTGTEPPTPLNAAWQQEVDDTAAAVIAKNAFLNMLVNPADAPSAHQYGNPASSVADPNLLNYDPAGTLANLESGNFGTSLQAQVLRAGLIARSFNIQHVNTPEFINNFFAAKIEESVNNPLVPLPSAALGGMCCVAILLVRRSGRPASIA